MSVDDGGYAPNIESSSSSTGAAPNHEWMQEPAQFHYPHGHATRALGSQPSSYPYDSNLSTQHIPIQPNARSARSQSYVSGDSSSSSQEMKNEYAPGMQHHAGSSRREVGMSLWGRRTIPYHLILSSGPNNLGAIRAHSCEPSTIKCQGARNHVSNLSRPRRNPHKHPMRAHLLFALHPRGPAHPPSVSRLQARHRPVEYPPRLSCLLIIMYNLFVLFLSQLFWKHAGGHWLPAIAISSAGLFCI